MIWFIRLGFIIGAIICIIVIALVIAEYQERKEGEFLDNEK